MDTYGIVERPEWKPKGVVHRLAGEIKTEVDRRAPYKGTPDVTACRVHSNFFGALVIDLPADVFD